MRLVCLSLRLSWQPRPWPVATRRFTVQHRPARGRWRNQQQRQQQAGTQRLHRHRGVRGVPRPSLRGRHLHLPHDQTQEEAQGADQATVSPATLHHASWTRLQVLKVHTDWFLQLFIGLYGYLLPQFPIFWTQFINMLSQLLYRILGLEDAFIPELRRIEPIPSMSEANLARLQRRRQAMEEERRAAKLTKPGDQQHNNEYAVSRVYFNLQHSSSSNLLNGWLWKFFGCGVGGTCSTILRWEQSIAGQQKHLLFKLATWSC